MKRASHQMRPNRLDDFTYPNQLLKYKGVSSGCKEVKIYICPPYHYICVFFEQPKDVCLHSYLRCN